jgi:hypothetical protein
MVKMENKKCKSCQKEIDPKAKKCPYCQADQRGWFRRHPVVTGIVVLLILIGVANLGNKQTPTNEAVLTSSGTKKVEEVVPSVVQPTSGPTHDDLMSGNNPDVKHLTMLTADYVGKSFTIYVNAETENYYNYGFDNEKAYYSLKLWDSSVTGDYDGVYGYIDRNNPNSKILVEKLLNGATFLKINASIPSAKYEQGSNSFLQINSWEEVQ